MACTWPDEPSIALDLGRFAQRRHLIADARAGEEIAVHHADVVRGHRSGHYAGGDEYTRAREECLTTLTAQIAHRHGIDAAQVAAAVGQRDPLLDGAVLLIFAGVFAIGANAFVRRLFDRFPPDDRGPALIALAVATVIVSAAGVMIGGLGASVVEMVALGDGHLSYRAARLPWNQYWLQLFAGGAALFCGIAARRWRQASSRAQ